MLLRMAFTVETHLIVQMAKHMKLREEEQEQQEQPKEREQSSKVHEGVY